MASVIIDASTAPAELLTCRVLGVPLVLWPLRALTRVMPLDRIAVMTSDPGIIGMIARHGVYPIPPSPATRTAPGLIVDPLQPFITERTLRAALEAVEHPPAGERPGAARLTAMQTSLVERLRIEDEESLAYASALARGLPPEHPAIDGVLRLRLPLNAEIRLVVCDVDGTLTDGGVTLGSSSEAQRTFHSHDGLGTHRLVKAGIQVAWLSATSSAESIHRRAEMLPVTHVDAGVGDKGQRFIEIGKRLGVRPTQTLYLGDDVNDLPAMRLAGISACPADARPEVRAHVDLVLETPGGKGAFRELAEIILSGRPRSLE